MEQLAKEFSSYRHHLIDHFLQDDLWSWQWWLGILLSVAPWVLWLLLRKRDSTWRLLGAAFLVMTVSIFFDTAGVVAGLWSYPVKLAPIPLFSGTFPWDYSVIPVSAMLWLQIRPGANPFAKAAVYAAAIAFVFHPLAALLGYVKEKPWVLILYVPFFFILYLLSHVYVSKIRFDRI